MPLLPPQARPYDHCYDIDLTGGAVVPDGDANHGGAPPHEFVTAWEVDDALDEAVPVDDADQHPEHEPQERPTSADDRFVVPWALPDG